MHELET